MTPHGRPRSLRATHRLAAVLVTLFWSAAPILAAVHASAEVHRYCAEHGMVEEGSSARTGAAADARPAARDASAPAPEHDGCAFARVCRFGQVLGPVILVAAGQLDPTPASAPTPATPAPPLAVLRLAPKTSPPV
jgi:hypothetical protein